jgi:probable rRNA maturation factor
VAVSFHSLKEGFELRQKIRHKKWISGYIRDQNKVPGAIACIFSSNDHVREINRKFLRHNHFTDVITFDYTDGKVITGDIFISVDQVRENAETYGVQFEEELRRVMIHGVLHLIGYTDRNEREREHMRKMEDDALNLWEKPE